MWIIVQFSSNGQFKANQYVPQIFSFVVESFLVKIKAYLTYSQNHQELFIRYHSKCLQTFVLWCLQGSSNNIGRTILGDSVRMSNKLFFFTSNDSTANEQLLIEFRLGVNWQPLKNRELIYIRAESPKRFFWYDSKCVGKLMYRDFKCMLI